MQLCPCCPRCVHRGLFLVPAGQRLKIWPGWLYRDCTGNGQPSRVWDALEIKLITDPGDETSSHSVSHNGRSQVKRSFLKKSVWLREITCLIPYSKMTVKSDAVRVHFTGKNDFHLNLIHLVYFSSWKSEKWTALFDLRSPVVIGVGGLTKLDERKGWVNSVQFPRLLSISGLLLAAGTHRKSRGHWSLSNRIGLLQSVELRQARALTTVKTKSLVLFA